METLAFSYLQFVCMLGNAATFSMYQYCYNIEVRNLGGRGGEGKRPDHTWASIS